MKLGVVGVLALRAFVKHCQSCYVGLFFLIFLAIVC
jgi:hypothetical protein